jgi:putative ATP-binding cassette transporter
VIFGLGSVLDVESSVRAGYALMFLYMMHPMEGMIEAIPELLQAQVSLSRIDSVTSGQSDIELGAAPAFEAFSGVALSAATHRYRRDMGDGEFVLGPIDLHLVPGEVVFLIGGNGSGKTSLAKLLVGLYEPEAGQQLLNGEPVSAADREAYRQHFSTVFSDFYLFDRLLGVDARNLDARAKELLHLLQLEHKVSVTEGVFSTTELSRGQQKRLALLVAFLEDRPVYVFDEWAADQDPQYRDVFYRELLPELKARGKAVLVISHDDRYFHLADRQLVLASGQLSAQPAPSAPVSADVSC